MADEAKNKLLDSPLYSFVSKGWRKWSKRIVALQVSKEDLLLYLTWALECLKGDDAEEFRDALYENLRDKFIECSFTSNQNDLKYIADLVCAASLSCLGLTLQESPERQEIYSSLVTGFGEDWAEIRNLKDSMKTDIRGLQEWLVGFMEGEEYYTYSDTIEWNDDMSEILINRAKEFAKVDMYRVIMALFEIGAFESADGGKLTKEKVFQAFGEMLDEDYSGFNNNLSTGSTNKNDLTIFQRLADGFEQYEQKKDEKLERQGKPKRR
jgi:hypothetical protein